jgi:hypothetical protein
VGLLYTRILKNCKSDICDGDGDLKIAEIEIKADLQGMNNRKFFSILDG